MRTIRVALVELPQLLLEILGRALQGQPSAIVVVEAESAIAAAMGVTSVDLVITGNPDLLAHPGYADVSVLGITPEGRSAMLRLPGEGYRTYSDLSPGALVTEVVMAVGSALPRWSNGR